MVMTLPMGGVMGNISWPGDLVSSIWRFVKYDIIYIIYERVYYIPYTK